jgi:hypothetical protein
MLGNDRRQGSEGHARSTQGSTQGRQPHKIWPDAARGGKGGRPVGMPTAGRAARDRRIPRPPWLCPAAHPCPPERPVGKKPAPTTSREDTRPDDQPGRHPTRRPAGKAPARTTAGRPPSRRGDRLPTGLARGVTSPRAAWRRSFFKIERACHETERPGGSSHQAIPRHHGRPCRTGSAPCPGRGRRRRHPGAGAGPRRPAEPGRRGARRTSWPAAPGWPPPWGGSWPTGPNRAPRGAPGS